MCVQQTHLLQFAGMLRCIGRCNLSRKKSAKLASVQITSVNLLIANWHFRNRKCFGQFRSRSRHARNREHVLSEVNLNLQTGSGFKVLLWISSPAREAEWLALSWWNSGRLFLKHPKTGDLVYDQSL